MTPTDDSSRFSAIPLTPFLNAIISPAMTPERPYTRAMPSPTSRTVPTSLRVISGENCSISRWMTELISSALNFMRLPFDQSMAKLCESVLHRRIIKVVANLDDQAADQAGIGRRVHDRSPVDQASQPVLEGSQLRFVER